MSRGIIEVNDRGFKISYARYLCDSAVFFVLVILGFSFRFKLIALLSPLGLELNLVDLSNVDKGFLILLLFVCSWPMGLLINTLSYLSLETILQRLEDVSNEVPSFFPETKKITSTLLDLSKKMNIPMVATERIPEITKRLVSYCEIVFSDIYDNYDYIRGLAIFLRHISFGIIVMSFIFMLLKGNLWLSLVNLLFTIVWFWTNLARKKFEKNISLIPTFAFVATISIIAMSKLNGFIIPSDLIVAIGIFDSLLLFTSLAAIVRVYHNGMIIQKLLVLVFIQNNESNVVRNTIRDILSS